MRRVSRFTRREREKRRFFLGILLFSVVIIGFFGSLLTMYLKRPKYISPIPSSSFKQQIKAVDTQTQTSDITKKLSENHVSYASVIANVDSYDVMLADGSEIIFSMSKNIDNQISSLQLILSHLTIEGKRIGRLDFRFDNPVIVFR